MAAATSRFSHVEFAFKDSDAALTGSHDKKKHNVPSRDEDAFTQLIQH
jgi:hypothetical protein